MNQSVKTIAKLQVPHLENIYPRERLLKKLGVESRTKLLWLSGSAGSGKTTLAANFLSTDNAQSVWYRVDEDDVDPASFFHYMALAAKKASPRRKLLPALTPEYQMGILTFARRFFELFFSQLKLPCVLVFDNYERVPQDSILHSILCEALDALPDAMTVLITSRRPPPAAFARFQASQNFTLLDDDVLTLTKEEAHAIAKIHSQQHLEKPQLDNIYKLSDGWLAGVILLANTKTLPIRPRPPAASLQTTFDYFAEEVFQGIEPESRLIMQQLAIMPFMSEAAANRLTDNQAAGLTLRHFAAENFFTYRHEEKKSAYRLHPLFRMFLLEQAEQTYTREKFADIKLKAAGILEAEEYFEAAFDLYVTSGQLSEAARLVCQKAPDLLQQGRFKTLLDWIAQLPQSLLEQAPWVLYWLGIGEMFPDPMASRLTLEKAYSAFKKQQDNLGAILSCCGIIDTFPMLWDDFHKMDVWIDNLELLLDITPEKLPPEIEARVTNAMAAGYFYRRTGHEDLQMWVTRSKNILFDTPDPFVRIMLLQNCFFSHIWKGELTNASLLLEQARPALTAKSSSSFSKIWFYTNESCYYWNCAQVDKSVEASEKALKLSSETGIHIMDALAHYHAGIANATNGRLEAARSNLESLRPLIIPGQLMNEVSYYQLIATIAWHEANLSKAFEAIKQAVELADQAGLNFAYAIQLIGLSIIQFEQGDAKLATSTLNKAEQIAQSDELTYLLFETQLFKAYFKLQSGQKNAALKALDIALNIGRKTDRVASCWWQPEIMSRLCALALDAGIHTDYVRLIIQKRQLLPDTAGHMLEQWPWPVRIYTLGGLHIEIDGQALAPGKKSPSKPLELLEILIALGANNIKATKLADMLWPEAEGDDALESFKTNLRRLRKLLQRDDALPLKEGRLSLNQAICWTDAQALLELSNTTENSDNIIHLYTGSFLGDQDTPWAMHLREQLRNSFLKAIQSQGKSQQSEGNWQQAIDCYEKGLAVEKFTEVFYQQLMVCYQQNNQPAEALHVFDRCKIILEHEFGISPSRKIQELAHTIKAMHQ